MPDRKEMYTLLYAAVRDYRFLAYHRDPDKVHWLMNLAWYKAIRRAFLQEDADDDARDESKWEPQQGDTVLGYRITVTGDGGAPHLADESQES